MIWANNIERDVNLALQKAIQNVQMVASGIMIGKEQLNISAYADDIVLIGKKEMEMTTFCRNGKPCRKAWTKQINQAKTKYMIMEMKNTLTTNKKRHLKIENYKFERAENLKYLRVVLNEDNNHQTH
jgi:hypothetical protein